MALVLSRRALLLWVLSLIVVAVQFGLGALVLPSHFPITFDLAGTPTRIATKLGYLAVFGLVLLAVNAWPPLAAIRALPLGWVTLPDRSYWTARPERRARLFEVLTTLFATCVALANLMILMSIQTVFDRVSNEPPTFSTITIASVGLVLLCFALGYGSVALRRGN